MQIMKTGVFRHRKAGKVFKLNIEFFREGSLDHLLSVDVKFLLKLKLSFVQKGP